MAFVVVLIAVWFTFLLILLEHGMSVKLDKVIRLLEEE